MPSVRSSLSLLLVATCCLVLTARVAAQDSYQPNWYAPGQPFIKIGVVADDVYALTGADLEAHGLSLSTLNPEALQIFENGREIPLLLEGATDGRVDPADRLLFVGKRNDGSDERWAYNDRQENQSSTYHSLYSDTTYYWLTVTPNATGLRFAMSTPPTGSSAAFNSFLDTLHIEETDHYYNGTTSENGFPLYTLGEGFLWSRFTHNNTNPISRIFSASLADPARGSLDSVRVQVRFVPETAASHQVVLQVERTVNGATSFVPADTIAWSGYNFADAMFAFPQSDLPASNEVRLRITSQNDLGNRIINIVSLDWFSIQYDRAITLANQSLPLSVDTTAPVELKGSGLTSASYILDTTNRTVQPVSGGAVQVRAATAPASFWIVPTGAGMRPVSMRTATSPDLANTSRQADYVIVTTALLRASAEQQAAYRASVAGGSFNVLIVDIQDIFDQFDGGRPTPIALRRFTETLRTWSTVPGYMLLWGDALYPDPRRPRQPWEVLSFGNSASDGWYGMQANGSNDWTEQLAIGRVTLRSNERGFIFRDKLQDYEAQVPNAWQKRALFLVGGTSRGEKLSLQTQTLLWSDLAATSAATLDTLHIFKSSSDALDPTFKDSLRTTLFEGISWLSYFGHSASTTWEIVTDPPQAFNNAQRLPVALSFGCYTGNFAIGNGSPEDIFSFGEDLVSKSLNGSIAHFGSTDAGTIGASANMSRRIHEAVFADSIRVLGDAMVAAKNRFAANLNERDVLNIKHSLQYGLIGDPATRISLPLQPDFSLDASRLTITPTAPLPADSVFSVQVRLANYGLIPRDSIDVMLTHTFPGGQQEVLMNRVRPFGQTATIRFDVPIDDNAIGDNTIQVSVDPFGAIAEVSELNNTASRTQVVFSAGLVLNSPAASGLVFTRTPALQASFASSNRNFSDALFELDTAPSFDSPNLLTARIALQNLEATWRTPSLRNATTYYWRVRPDSPDGRENWTNGIFTVRGDLNSNGWLQQGDLFSGNERSPVLTYEDGAWGFRTFAVDVTASSVNRSPDENKGQFVYNGSVYQRLGLGWGVLLINGATAEVKGSASGPTYGNNFVDPVMSFTALKALVAQAERGDYIITRTRNLALGGAVEIPDSVKAFFRELGSTAIDTLTYEDLWIMKTRVDLPEETVEYAIPRSSPINEITETFSLTFNFSEAEMLSPVIGPVRSWGRLGVEGQLPSETSDLRVEIWNEEGTSRLMEAISINSTLDLSLINPEEHPSIRLRSLFTDSASQATPQLEAWYVTYTPVPELALDPDAFSLSSDTLQQGAPLDVQAVVRNFTLGTTDEILLDYLLTGPDNATILIHQDTLRDVRNFAESTYQIDTSSLLGPQGLMLRVRQPGLRERTTFDNVLLGSFVVRRDQQPPMFEVRIDGEVFPSDPEPVVNLQDPALPFVQNQPTVEITIEDENPYFSLKADTTVVLVTLNDEPLPYTDLLTRKGKRKDVLFLQFQLDLAGADTTHTLRVHVQDATGNEAPNSPYQVHVRTQAELEVESVYPYPNPMNTSTTFAFRLRGRDAIDVQQLRLRIYSLSGLLIREFDLVEDPHHLKAGSLRIGWNKLVWDGRDEDGDLVATGVYLYRVVGRTTDGQLPLGSTDRIEKVVVIR